jgi:hypothetical protein
MSSGGSNTRSRRNNFKRSSDNLKDINLRKGDEKDVHWVHSERITTLSSDEEIDNSLIGGFKNFIKHEEDKKFHELDTQLINPDADLIRIIHKNELY